MSLDEFEKVAEDFLREKHDASSVNITSIKSVTSMHYEAKGDYSKKDSDRIEAKFTLTINKSTKKIVGYEFESPTSGRRG